MRAECGWVCWGQGRQSIRRGGLECGRGCRGGDGRKERQVDSSRRPAAAAPCQAHAGQARPRPCNTHTQARRAALSAHLGQPVAALRVARRQRHIIEQAVAKGRVGGGVVPRRARDAEGGGAGPPAAAGGHHSVHQGRGGARGPQGVVEGGLRDVGDAVWGHGSTRREGWGGGRSGWSGRALGSGTAGGGGADGRAGGGKA